MAKTLHQLQLEMSLMRRHSREPKAEVAAELLTRILIVADDRLAGRHLARMLTGMGYAGVRAVNSAARALVLAQQYAPGIIFSMLVCGTTPTSLRARCSGRRARMRRASSRLPAISSIRRENRLAVPASSDGSSHPWCRTNSTTCCAVTIIRARPEDFGFGE